jgi:hypothetical protein
MQVEAFTAKHPAVNRMRCITFNQYAVILVLMNKHTAPNTAVTAG